MLSVYYTILETLPEWLRPCMFSYLPIKYTDLYSDKRTCGFPYFDFRGMGDHFRKGHDETGSI